MNKNTDREKLELTKQEARNMVYGDLDGYTVIVDDVVDNSRWSIIKYCVVKRESDGKFFADDYSVGATESQDERAFEYTEPNFREVFPKEKVVITYE